MSETRRSKTDYLAWKKRDLVLGCGCSECGAGKLEGGFEQYWFNHRHWEPGCYDGGYDARRFVFKYTDPGDSDVPVAHLPRMKTTTKTTIDEALARCVILCRSCADPRRTRKDDSQCQKQTTNNSPTSS